MKKINLIIFVLLILILSPKNECLGQYVYCKYTKDGVENKYPVLKKSGNTWYWNSRATKNPKWESETYPFYINSEGELFDVNQVKIGWYINDDYYLMDGWVVLDNKKTFYKHKEMIFKPDEITGRTCSDQRFWFVSKGDNKNYVFQTTDKINGRKTVLSLELVNLVMDKITAVALFEFIKMGRNDTDPCGFGSDDVRPEFTTATPLTEREIQDKDTKELLARLKARKVNGIDLSPGEFTTSEEPKKVSFINKTQSDVFVAIAWYENGNWYSKGWYNIKPGQETVVFNREYPYEKIYWYAEDGQGGKGKIWDANNDPLGIRFPIERPNDFEITNQEAYSNRASFHELKITSNNMSQTISD